MAQRAGKYKISRRDKKLFDLDASTINTTGTNLTLSGFLKTQGNGTQLGNGTGDTLGFFGAVPVNQPSAYTQTYSTGNKTVANPTAATLTDNSGGTASQTIAAIGSSYNQGEVRNAVASLTDEVNKLVADNLDLRQAITSIIDDLQELGLVG